VPLGGVRARCSVCGGVISVSAPEFATAAVASDSAPLTESFAVEAVEPPAVKDSFPEFEPIQSVEPVERDEMVPFVETSDDDIAGEFDSDFEAMPEPVAAAEPEVIAPPPRAPTPVFTPAVPPRATTPAFTAPQPPPVTAVPRPEPPPLPPPMPGSGPGSTPRPFPSVGVTGSTPPRAPFAPARPTMAPGSPMQPPRPSGSMSTVPPAAPPAVPPAALSAPARPTPMVPTPPVAPRTTQPRTITSQPFAPPVMPPRPVAPTPTPTPIATPGATTPVQSVPSVMPLAPQSTVSKVTAPTPIVPPPGSPAKRAPNPFLANDPNQKAKRLARALVSDMVAYLPQKREEGIKNNTLKQLFREEIKKSYEEYVDQIGKDFADSTTHFQDALNDVLAGGKKIF